MSSSWCCSLSPTLSAGCAPPCSCAAITRTRSPVRIPRVLRPARVVRVRAAGREWTPAAHAPVARRGGRGEVAVPRLDGAAWSVGRRHVADHAVEQAAENSRQRCVQACRRRPALVAAVRAGFFAGQGSRCGRGFEIADRARGGRAAVVAELTSGGPRQVGGNDRGGHPHAALSARGGRPVHLRTRCGWTDRCEHTFPMLRIRRGDRKAPPGPRLGRSKLSCQWSDQ